MNKDKHITKQQENFILMFRHEFSKLLSLFYPSVLGSIPIVTCFFFNCLKCITTVMVISAIENKLLR